MKLNQRFSHAQGRGTGSRAQPIFSFSRLPLQNAKRDRNKMGGKCEACEKWKEEMYWTNFKVVHFFSVLTRNFRSYFKFPEKLVKKCLVNELPKTSVVTLKEPNGKTWTVELVRIGSDGDEMLYLKGGWEAFVKENNLKEHGFLLFKYNLGTSVFEVFMFDEANFCEKERFCLKAWKEGLDQRKRVKTEPWLEKKGSHHKSKWLNEKKRVKREPSISDDDEEEQGYGRVIPRARLTSPPPDRKGKAVKLEKESEDDEVTQVNRQPQGHQIKTARSKNENAGAFVKAVHEGKQRRALHFAVCMKRTHVSAIYFMTVPIEKARQYIAPETERVFLEMNGETWIADYRFKAGSWGISGKGWIDFVEDNHIKVGDECLFEIISNEPVVLKVSVIRR